MPGLLPPVLRLFAQWVSGLLKPAWICLAAGVLAAPCVAQDAANWPQFRGPNSLGVAVNQEVPVKFSAKDNLNLLWKSPVKIGGISSPVVWGDRIFLTGGDTEQRQLYCYGADGKLLWTQDVKWNKPNAKQKQGEDEDAAAEPELRANVACNTPATDGRRVYATYGTGDVVAYDFTGQKLWAISLWTIESQNGFCSSPILYQGKLIIQLDHSGESALIALDTATGKEVWRFGCGGRMDSPPTIHDGLALFGCTDGWVYAVRTQDGQEAWRFRVAPVERLTGGSGRVESPWPVKGSVLVQGGKAYAIAGRSSYLDGGIVLVALDPATGQLLHETHVANTSAEIPVKSTTLESGFDLVGLRGQSRVNWIREGRLAECSEHPSSYGRATRNLHE